MERIKEAVAFAKALKRQEAVHAGAEQQAALQARPMNGAAGPVAQVAPPTANGIAWQGASVLLNSAHLDRQKIVAHAASDRSHVAFNILRTKLSQILGANKWTTVAVTSPGAGCGKTMVAVNLAFSLARQKNCRTVLIDLDLRKASVAKTLGVVPDHSLGEYLEGRCRLEDSFIKVTDTAFFGLNNGRRNKVFELAQLEATRTLIEQVKNLFEPQVILVDLPPILTNDEVITFLPFVDCGFLVAASGKTTAKEIEECEAEFVGASEFLGVVLNKCTDLPEDYSA